MRTFRDSYKRGNVVLGSWCRNAKCFELQRELDELAEVIKKVEKLVIPVG